MPDAQPTVLPAGREPERNTADLSPRERQKLAVRQRDELYQQVMANLQRCDDPRVAATLLRLGLQILKDRDAAARELDAPPSTPGAPPAPPTAPPRRPAPRLPKEPRPDLAALLHAAPWEATTELSCVGPTAWPKTARPPAPPTSSASPSR